MQPLDLDANSSSLVALAIPYLVTVTTSSFGFITTIPITVSSTPRLIPLTPLADLPLGLTVLLLNLADILLAVITITSSSSVASSASTISSSSTNPITLVTLNLLDNCANAKRFICPFLVTSTK